jgi:hypothetical protein
MLGIVSPDSRISVRCSDPNQDVSAGRDQNFRHLVPIDIFDGIQQRQHSIGSGPER